MKFHTAPGSAQNGEGYLPLELIETLLDPQCALPAPYASSTSPLAPAPAVVADHSPVSQIPAPTCAARELRLDEDRCRWEERERVELLRDGEPYAPSAGSFIVDVEDAVDATDAV